MRFGLLVVRDIVLFFLTVQGVIAGVGFIMCAQPLGWSARVGRSSGRRGAASPGLAKARGGVRAYNSCPVRKLANLEQCAEQPRILVVSTVLLSSSVARARRKRDAVATK